MVVMCQACGLENEESETDCARCGYRLEPEGPGSAADQPTSDELEVMLDDLNLPVADTLDPAATVVPTSQTEVARPIEEEPSTSEPDTPLRTFLPRLPLGCVLGAVTAALPGVLILLAAVYLETAGGPQQSKTPIGLLGLAGIGLTVGGVFAGFLVGGLIGLLGMIIGWSIRRKRGATIGAMAGGVLGGALAIAGIVSSFLSGSPTTP
jgi:hypothetical protein